MPRARSQRPDPTAAKPAEANAPALRAPEGLAAWQFSVKDEAFALLEWPTSKPMLVTQLTPAESDVARLVLKGLSTAQIAQHRGWSPRSVANQVASIFRKLGVGSRASLTAWLSRAGR